MENKENRMKIIELLDEVIIKPSSSLCGSYGTIVEERWWLEDVYQL